MEYEIRPVDYRKDIMMVVSNEFIMAVHPQENEMGVFAMKLFRLAIAQCRMKDKRFYSYEFKVSDLTDLVGINSSNIYRDAQKMCLFLMKTVLMKGKAERKQKWELKHIFEKCSYNPENGVITILFHEDMTELFLHLTRFSRFTQVEIGQLLSIKTRYAIRLFEYIHMRLMRVLPHADHAVELYISCDELRQITGTDTMKTYDHLSHLKEKVLLPSIAEIEKAAEWKIICTNAKDGRKVTGFNLEIWSEAGYRMIEKLKAKGLFSDE